MFITNNAGEYIRMESVVAISVHEKCIKLYSNKACINKEVDIFRPSFPLSSILNKMRELYGVHILHIGNHYFVIEQIEGITLIDDGLLVNTVQREFRVQLSEAEIEKAAEDMYRYLPTF